LNHTPGTEQFASRRIELLFAKAPTTFGWRDLLVDSPNLQSAAAHDVRGAYLAETSAWYNVISTWLVGGWTVLLVLFVVGFGYSYFFTASTMIYLLMRYRVDDTDIDEVFAEDEFPDEPILPPTPAPAPTPTVQMVDAPTIRPPIPNDKPASNP
jgi:hypothetical protein